ncbi:hypothetical protein Tco_1060440 [Tanacetum coccineum]
MDSMFTMWKRLMDENLSVARIVGNMNHVDKISAPSHESPIVQSVNIITKLASYAGAMGASAKDQPKVNSNFHPLVADLVFNGGNISIPRKVVKKDYDEYRRLFFFKFDTRAGLEAVLESVPWMICNSLIILKKWSMELDFLKKNCPKKMVSPPIVDTSNVVTPTVEKTNDGFQTVGKKKNRKGKSKSTKGVSFAVTFG